MKLYIESKLIKDKYDNLIIKGNFCSNSQVIISKKTELQLKNKRIKIYINHIGGAEIIENFKCLIEAEEGNYRVNVGGGSPCIFTVSKGCKGNFSANIYRGSKVFIGPNTTSNGCEVFCDNSFFITGKDCMISNEVTFQASDQHAIINLDNGNIVNNLKTYGGIALENHVWIGRRSILVGHFNIQNGSIVGIGSVLTSNVPSNTIYAGNPAKKIKDNVTWCRHPDRYEEYVLQNLTTSLTKPLWTKSP